MKEAVDHTFSIVRHIGTVGQVKLDSSLGEVGLVRRMDNLHMYTAILHVPLGECR